MLGGTERENIYMTHRKVLHRKALPNVKMANTFHCGFHIKDLHQSTWDNCFILIGCLHPVSGPKPIVAWVLVIYPLWEFEYPHNSANTTDMRLDQISDTILIRYLLKWVSLIWSSVSVLYHWFNQVAYQYCITDLVFTSFGQANCIHCSRWLLMCWDKPLPCYKRLHMSVLILEYKIYIHWNRTIHPIISGARVWYLIL